MSQSSPDAIVVGAGPNGLVAANILADAGWSVLVVEAMDEPGGAVRSSDYLGQDTIADVCSAFYPLGAASPVLHALGLQDFGLRWSHAPDVLAHPLPDGRCAVLSRDLRRTTASLNELSDGDGDAWQRLVALWDRVGDELLDAVFTPFPPVRAGLRLASKLDAAGALRLARTAVLPVRKLIQEDFTGPGAMLLAGCALHADLSPEATGSGAFGWILAMLGQRVGFPAVQGGAGALTAALVRRLESRGGVVRCGSAVSQVVIRNGAAVGIRTENGESIKASRAVLADVAAPLLFGELVSWDELPAGMQDDMRRFQWDYATFKVDWLVRDGIPWTAREAAGAGTVHIADSLNELTQSAAHIAMQQVPAHPFLLLGQMTTADPTRSPQGTEVAWAYTHVPRTVRGDAGGTVSGRWDEADNEQLRSRIERRIENHAPGFRDRIISQHTSSPRDLQRHNPNLVGGAINGGTMQVHQQLVFRPIPGLGRPATPIAGLYLASASAHPGGGVHGACGANAARAALAAARLTRRAWSRGAQLATRH